MESIMRRMPHDYAPETHRPSVGDYIIRSPDASDTEPRPSGMLTIRRHRWGPYQANAWLASDDVRREAFLVDAGARRSGCSGRSSPEVSSEPRSFRPTRTRTHIGALPEIVAATGAPVYLHPDAEPMLHPPRRTSPRWPEPR